MTGLSRAIFSVSLAMLCFSLVIVGLRSLVRLKMIRAFGWDDGLMLLAMALFTLVCVSAMIGSFYGVGRRFKDIPPEDIRPALLCFFLSELGYILTCTVGRLSICITILRITVERIHKVILYIVMVVTIITGFVTWLVILVQCHPVSHFWNPEENGSCGKVEIVIITGYVYTGFAIICDFTIGLLPIAIVWRLQRSLRTRVALALILGLGCISSCALVARLPFFPKFRDPDTLYGTTQILLLSVIEDGLGIAAGSLTTLRPLFRFFRSESCNNSGINSNRYISTMFRYLQFSKRPRSLDRPGPWIHIETYSNDSANESMEGWAQACSRHA